MVSSFYSTSSEDTVGMDWKGAWVTATAYALNDAVYVSSTGQSYICIVKHTSGTWGTDLAAAYWSQMVAKGTDGDDGDDGSDGTGAGTVTQIVASTGLSGGTITTSGTIAIIKAVTSEVTTGTDDAKPLTSAALAGSSPALIAPTLSAGGATTAGSIKFKEGTDNGTNTVTVIGPVATADATLTLPAATDTLVGKATTDTLTNKTLTTPTMSAPVLSAGGTTTAGSIKFKEGTDNGTNAVTLIGPVSTADVTVILPAAADTLVGKATTDTLTNKTLTTPTMSAPVLSAGGTTTAGSIKFKEGTDNGTNTVTLIGPAATADVVVTLPAATTTLAAAGANSDITSITGLTTDLTVAQGGTGASTLTDGGVLLGAGTGAITAMSVLADGAIIIGDNVGDPTAVAAFTTDGNDNLLPAKGGSIGQQTIWVPAGAMEVGASTTPAASNSAEIGTSLFAARTMDFVHTADTFAYFGIQMPKSWDAGALLCQFLASSTSTTGTVMWGISARSLTDGDSSTDVLTTAFSTDTTQIDTISVAEEVYMSPEVSVTVTNAAAEEYVIFRVRRVVASDANGGSVRLHGIKIHYTVDTGVDT